MPRRRPPLLPEPKAPFSNRPPFLLSAEPKKEISMQIHAQSVKTIPTSIVDASNEQQQENVATAPRSIYADCRDEEEVIILKYQSNDNDVDDTAEMIEEITPEPKQIDVVTIEEEDDDETSALREILLKSLKEKKVGFFLFDSTPTSVVVFHFNLRLKNRSKKKIFRRRRRRRKRDSKKQHRCPFQKFLR